MRRRTLFAAIAGGAITLLGGFLVYRAIFAVELDSDARNAPIPVALLSVGQRFDIPAEIGLAAGIAYDVANGVFVVSTDQPHSLLPKSEVGIFVLDAAFESVVAEMTFDTDGDLEGVVVLAANRYVAASEAGTLYVVERNSDGTLRLADTIRALDSGKHKLGSLAYDTASGHFYTAEKEGQKIIYRIDESGTLVDSFELAIPSELQSRASRDFTMGDDFTIAGMHYHHGHLLIFSEAYSTLFRLDLATREIVNVYGIDGLPESAGVTVREDKLYFVGDQESYLPPPQVHVVQLP